MSIVVMKRKAAIRAKNQNKKNIYANSCGCTKSNSNVKNMGYGNYLRRKNIARCICPGDSGNPIPLKNRVIVKDRLNSGIDFEQHIEHRKLAVIQRIRCDEKDGANNNNNANNGKCKVARENRSGVGYTRKESILRFCNTTKDLKLAGQGKSYSELYAALKSEKAFNCDDLKNERTNDGQCKSR